MNKIKTINKTCFVIMGFGTKMDYKKSKKVNLDLIYNKVIRKVFKEYPQYTLIRSDDILISQLIDSSMYAMIMRADLVIAVISTLNANALYELGIRHALKPYSTIIMMQNSEKEIIPFDLNHISILFYKDYSEKIPEKEAKVIRNKLHRLINNTIFKITDSPVYTALPEKERPDNVEQCYRNVLNSLQNKKTKSVRSMLDQAEGLMKENKFAEAEKVWKKLHDALPEEEYIVQQMALAQYKPEKEMDKKEEEKDNAIKALNTALDTINILKPKSSLNLETLGITGAIYKRLFKWKKDFDDLDQAIFYYRKGYVIQNDYYNGENYAFCLLEKTQKAGLSKEEASYLKYLAINTYHDIVKMLEKTFDDLSAEEIEYWMYATLSTSYYCIGNMTGHERYHKIFLNIEKAEWENDSYIKQLERVKKLL